MTAGRGGPSGASFPQDGFLAAPTAQVGVLTPPAGTRVDDTRVDGFRLDETRVDGFRVDDLPDDGPLLAGPSAAPYLGGQSVRPGHGLDGPEITSSWPAQPQTDTYEDFWQEADGNADYSQLFEDEATGARAAGKRGTGRRRGRSNDKRLWLALGGVVVTAAAAITGIIKFEFPSHGGPVHTMAVPDKIGSYLRAPNLERSTKVGQLPGEIIKESGGQASGVVSAEYESGKATAGSAVQILVIVEGHLANADPAASIASFTKQFPGARIIGAGPLGGQAACVEQGAHSADAKSICVFFDNDSFGDIVSPTMSAAALADVMRTVRPSVEFVAKK
jgi:hypothetical protein